MIDLLQYENSCAARGLELVCGVDEAGRGPLAGPVTVAAIIPDLTRIVKGVNDSKKLTDKKRRELYPQIIETAICYKSVSESNEEIDKINILEATKRAMTEAVNCLFPIPHVVLVDAVKLKLHVECVPIIHGDALSYAIAAASIIAKVERDDMMIKFAELYPEYGFEEHKGYGTEHHIEMLKKYGPCPIHRASFLKKIL